MTAVSGYKDLPHLCMLIHTNDCQKIFFKWRSLEDVSKFNVTAVVDYMRNNLNEGALSHEYFSAVENGSYTSEDELLRLVAQRCGGVLLAFLEALKMHRPMSYYSLEADLKKTFDGYPCKVADTSCELSESIRRALKESMNEKARLLLLCPKCEDVMDDPVILPCLHSCCRKCLDTSCCRCGRQVKDFSCKTNSFVLSQIALAAKLMGNEQPPDGSPSSSAMCAVHGCELKSWCTVCKGFFCDTYVVNKCGNNKHRYSRVDDIANGVRRWIAVFLHSEPVPDVSDNLVHSETVQTHFDRKRFTEKYMEVLTKKKQRLSFESERAFTDAKEMLEVHCRALDREVREFSEQFMHAKLYATSISDDNLFIVDQRELLLQQLQLLLFQTGNASLCQNLPRYEDLCISGLSEPPYRNRERLFIDCLDDAYDYVPVTQELVGKPKLIETDVPVHPIWDRDHMVIRENENFSFVCDLERQVKMKEQRLHDALMTVQNLQQELCAKQKLIEDLSSKQCSQSNEPVRATTLIDNLQKTSCYVSQHILQGELDAVIARLKSMNYIIQRDIDRIEAKEGTIKQAEYLINDIIIKSGSAAKVERFLKMLQDDAKRKDLADIVRSGNDSS